MKPFSVEQKAENNSDTGSEEDVMEDLQPNEASDVSSSAAIEALYKGSAGKTVRGRLESLKKKFAKPTSRLQRSWQQFVFALMIYNIVAIPFRVVFNTGLYGVWYFLDYLADAVFILDIVTKFHLRYIKDGVLVDNSAKVKERYLKGWFAVDVLASLPLDLFYW